jgi:hypothetical protein
MDNFQTLTFDELKKIIEDFKSGPPHESNLVQVEVGINDNGFMVTELRDPETNDVVGEIGVMVNGTE